MGTLDRVNMATSDVEYCVFMAAIVHFWFVIKDNATENDLAHGQLAERVNSLLIDGVSSELSRFVASRLETVQ